MLCGILLSSIRLILIFQSLKYILASEMLTVLNCTPIMVFLMSAFCCARKEEHLSWVALAIVGFFVAGLGVMFGPEIANQYFQDFDLWNKVN